MNVDRQQTVAGFTLWARDSVTVDFHKNEQGWGRHFYGDYQEC